VPASRPARPNPAIPRQELADRLRDLRLSSGRTLEGAADELMISSTKLSRIETATRPVSLRDVRELTRLYGVSEAQQQTLMRLARESRVRSYWHQFGSRISEYAELEDAASAISDYESALVPALLQTEDYATALAAGSEFQGDPQERENAVRARLARQSKLDDERAPRFASVMDEAVLRRVVGSPPVMTAQLRFLADRASALDSVTVQVLPFVAGAHPGMDSTFTVLHFDESVSDVVYVEGLVGSIYLRKPSDIDRYTRVFRRLQELALPPDESLDVIVRAADAIGRSRPSTGVKDR
jgi:transcriptional regulator with XRE-family HTH domain